MNTKYIFGLIIGVLIIILAVLVLKNNTPDQTTTSNVRVVTSFYPLYFFASEIAGDKASVTNITPAGAEPHDYEPTARDIANIENSNLLILNGGNLETWAASIASNSNPEKTTIITAGEGFVVEEVSENSKKITDPHIWLSPPLAKQMVDKIESGFTKVDPNNASSYKYNAEMLKSKLDALDDEFKAGLAVCKNANIITSHTAFSYLAATYHFNQIAIAGISPESEPSPQDLIRIAKFAKDNNVKYIFFESLASPKLSETIATEVGAQTLVLNPIEGLSNKDISAGKNYFSEMRQNLINLKTALECTQ